MSKKNIYCQWLITWYSEDELGHCDEEEFEELASQFEHWMKAHNEINDHPLRIIEVDDFESGIVEAVNGKVVKVKP